MIRETRRTKTNRSRGEKISSLSSSSSFLPLSTSNQLRPTHKRCFWSIIFSSNRTTLTKWNILISWIAAHFLLALSSLSHLWWNKTNERSETTFHEDFSFFKGLFFWSIELPFAINITLEFNLILTLKYKISILIKFRD